MLDKEFLDLLACPKCKGEEKKTDAQGKEEIVRTDLEYRPEDRVLICHTCRLKFSISEDDIPNFLLDEAESL